jgi:hAT family C-terminal dimerisation region
LHPKHKLRYFEKQNWEDDWVKTVEEIVREEFKRNYEEYRVLNKKSSQSLKRKVGIHIYYYFFIILRIFQSHTDDSDVSETSSSSSDDEAFADELDRYLSSRRIKKVDDPIGWWHENQESYPRLSRMAKDYLTIPGQYPFFFVEFSTKLFYYDFSCVGCS